MCLLRIMSEKNLKVEQATIQKTSCGIIKIKIKYWLNFQSFTFKLCQMM